MSASIFSMLLEASLLKFEDAQEYLKKQVKATATIAQDRFYQAIRFFLLSFLVTIPMLSIGIYFDLKGLIVLAGVIRALDTIYLLFILAPLGILFQLAFGGGKNSVKNYANFLMNVFLTELIITLIFSLVPLRTMPGMIPVFILVTWILGFMGFWVASPGLTGSMVLGVFCVMTWGFFSPNSFASLKTKLTRQDENKGAPQRVMLTYADLAESKIVLFGPDGKSRYWYWQDPQTKEVEVYEVMTSNTIHPQNGQRLRPLKPADAETLRNILRSKIGTAKSPPASTPARSQPSTRNSGRERNAQRQREQAEREASRIAAEHGRHEKESQRARENKLNQYVRARKMQNLPNSVEAAVMFVDTDYRPLDNWNRELVKQLIFANVNTTGDFFQRSAAFEVFSKAYRGDQAFINELGLSGQVDCLVLGIVSTEDVPRTQWSKRATRFKIAVRLIPVGRSAGNLQEFKTTTQEENRDEAMKKALRAIQIPLVPALKSI